MDNKEILENRRKIILDICQHIRLNHFKLMNAKNFSERPYLDGEIKRKFNTLNYLRILAADRNYSDPRWFSLHDIQINHWTLKENAAPEFLEVIKDGSTSLQEFFNAADVNELEKFETENRSLDEVLDFLIVRGILESDENKISLQDGINAVKNYAAKFFQDDLIQILTVQMWLVESKLKTKLDLFLPTYSDDILTEIEKTPEIFLQKIQQASDVLKILRKERIKPIAEEINFDSLFQGLKIIYHGSDVEIKDNQGFSYSAETILTGVSAYEFLYDWKMQEEISKTWIEFSYQDYHHGKLLLTNNADDLSVSEILKNRLEKNRHDLLNNPQNLPIYILSDTDELIPKEKIIERIKKEYDDFQNIFATFETDEEKYLEIHSQKMV